MHLPRATIKQRGSVCSQAVIDGKSNGGHIVSVLLLVEFLLLERANVLRLGLLK